MLVVKTIVVRKSLPIWECRFESGRGYQLIVHPKLWNNELQVLEDNPYSKPTEQECIDGLAQLQTDFDNAKTKQETDKASANAKLQALGLTDDEITAITRG